MGFLSSLFGIGGGSSKPATQQVVQTSKLPEEIAPFAKDVLERAQAEFERRTAEGYTPYEGATIAPFTAQEEAAQEGIQALVGTSRPLQEEALALTRQQQQQFTPEVAEQFMSPYQRAVTDIEKREAQRTFERDIMPQLEAQAIGAGGMSGLGTRAALQASEAQRNQAQLLADIEARGLQSAFQDARKSFEQQKARERAQAADVFAAGPAMFTSGLQEQGALQTVGEQRRDLAQSALDEEYFKFLEEQAFPQERLAEYSGFVYGNPLLQQRTRTTTGTMQQAQPSLGRQLLGLAGTGVGIYGMGGGFKPGGQFSLGNLYSNVFGATGGGLSDLVKRQTSGRVGFVPPTRERFLDPEYENPIGRGTKEGVEELIELLRDPPRFIGATGRRNRQQEMMGMPEESEASAEEIAFMRSRGVPESKLAIDPEALKTRRREAEAGVGDFPVTPSRETEEEARRQRRAAGLQDLLRIRQEAEAGVGDAPVTPSLETEEIARQQARQRPLQDLLRVRQEAGAGIGASDLGQRMNPALQRELAARDREMARRRQLAETTQGVTGVDIGRQAVALAEDAGRGIAALDARQGGEKRTSPNYLTGSRRPGQPRVGDKTFLDRLYNLVPDMPETRAKLEQLRRQEQPIIDEFEEESMGGLFPPKEADTASVAEIKNILAQTAKASSPEQPDASQADIDAMRLGRGKRPDSVKSIKAQDSKPDSKIVSVGDEKVSVPPSNELNKLTGKVTQTSEFATMMKNLGDEEKKLINRFGKFEKLQEQLAKAQEEDGKNQLARANRANEINFWQGIVNIGGRLASTDDNWIGILSDETSKFMQRRKLLDAEITNKTGAAKIAALKTRADIALKDINFLNSLAKTKSERIKATAAWLKANGATAKDIETKSKNFATMVQKYAGENYTSDTRMETIEALMKAGVPFLLTMSSAQAFNAALEETNLKPSENKAQTKDGGKKSSDTVKKAGDNIKAKTQNMFGANS